MLTKCKHIISTPVAPLTQHIKMQSDEVSAQDCMCHHAMNASKGIFDKIKVNKCLSTEFIIIYCTR